MITSRLWKRSICTGRLLNVRLYWPRLTRFHAGFFYVRYLHSLLQSRQTIYDQWWPGLTHRVTVLMKQTGQRYELLCRDWSGRRCRCRAIAQDQQGIRANQRCPAAGNARPARGSFYLIYGDATFCWTMRIAGLPPAREWRAECAIWQVWTTHNPYWFYASLIKWSSTWIFRL